MTYLTLCSKMTQLTVSGYNIFSSTNIYSSKECNISFERAQKKVVFMEANNIFKKIFKSLKVDKNNSQNLSKEKKNVKSLCCTNLKYAFSIFLFI